VGDPATTELARRDFLGLALRSGLAALACACGPDREYRSSDEARLAEQRLQERMRSGRGPFGSLRFRGYRGLAELPYFELDAGGQLRAVGDLPPAFDLHAHLGMALFLAPALDLQARTPRVHHMLACDPPAPCDLDLDVYANSNFEEEALGRLKRKVAAQFLWGNAEAKTHTIPNLLAEMDAVGVERAALLPIAFGLPFRDSLTETWTEAVDTAGVRDRLWPCASVHPRAGDKVARLRRYAAGGARMVKLHPAGQRFYADERVAMEVYAECERLGLPVFFHAGRAGIEPEAGLNYNLMRHMRRVPEEFPRLRVVLGHAGARDVEEASALARAHDNVWLGTHGQGATVLHGLLRDVGPEKLLFGSDWPWYHLAYSLAKVLLATEGWPEARVAVLHGNADRLFATPVGGNEHRR
jgi:predicted TIM-barrel fold metal-dependent hydrolase